MKRKLYMILAVLTAVFACMIAAVRAAGPCSLRVTVLDEQEVPVPRINVELCCIAVTGAGGTQLTPDYAELPLTAEQLLADHGAEQAELVYQYISAMELEGIIKTTNRSGEAAFSGLEKGIYMVLERGGQHVSFQPYLVVLPTVMSGVPQYALSSIPKTSQTDTRALWVSVLWEDDLNAAGKRPGSVEISVLREGVVIRRVILSDANYWQHTFLQLPRTGTYTVQQKKISRYSTEYEEVMEGFIIVNTYTGQGGGGGITPPGPPKPPVTAHVTVRKVWDDQNDQALKRPASVTVQLIGGGTVIKTAVLNEANHWEHTFSGLEASTSYTVREIAVDSYQAAYSGNASTGITITNQYKTGGTTPGTQPDPVVPQPKPVDIPVTVRWHDEEDKAGARPDSVTVRLIAAGSVVAVLELDAAQGWHGVFRQVPSDLSYTVWQGAVTDYTTAYSGSAAEGFVVDNTYTKGTTGPGTLPDPTPVDPAPDDPDAPDTPDKPDGPVLPDHPQPDKPPQKPNIPQTGAVLWPTYVLLGAGILMGVLGLMCRRMRRKLLVGTGLLLMLAGGVRAAMQAYEAQQAHLSAAALLEGLERQQIEEQAASTIREEVPAGQTAVTQLADYSLMGSVEIPALELKLPIQDSWNYKLLKTAPCRYSGSVDGNDLILMAHNYDKHFGRLDRLQAGDRVEFCAVDGERTVYQVTGTEVLKKDQLDVLTDGEGDLTLFTCTVGGQKRVVVRCERMEEGSAV